MHPKKYATLIFHLFSQLIFLLKWRLRKMLVSSRRNIPRAQCLVFQKRSVEMQPSKHLQCFRRGAVCKCQHGCGIAYPCPHPSQNQVLTFWDIMSFLEGQLSHHKRLVESGVAKCPIWSQGWHQAHLAGWCPGHVDFSEMSVNQDWSWRT